jgi:hypothetical protein
MSDSNVFFGLRGKRYPFEFRRDLLRVGKLVYVRFDDGGEPSSFSLDPTRDAKPFCVTWIALSEWYVVLEDTYPDYPQIVSRVVQVVGPALDRTTIEHALSEAAADIRLEDLYKTAAYESSRLSVVDTVADRLNLYARLQNREASEAVWMHWGPLCVYLLLTCFDRLGQPADWVSFDEWLRSSKTEPERATALTHIPADADHLQGATILHKTYSERYGVRSAFFRFLREVLPTQQRNALLSSIEILTLSMPPDIGEPVAASEAEKEKYLFRLRNDYTHKSLIRVRPIDNRIFGVGRGSEARFVRQQQEQAFTENKWRSVETLGWPDVLEDAVRSGLVVYLRQLAEGTEDPG